MNYLNKILVVYILQIVCLVSLWSQTEDTKEDKWKKLAEKTQINVIGENKESLKKIPGSATIVDKKFLEETQAVDSMEILRRVPGASVRFMDSSGLTPNISFRGVSNEESRKTLILEDGVLVSLSPYGQPESYYSPQIDKMTRVEVVKGSGSILFGPSTIGGVVNFVTRKPPFKPIFSNKSIGGMNNFVSNFMQYGGTFDKTSYDFSYLHKSGDGYRDHNEFNVNEITGKMIHEINERHTLTLKLSAHQQKANATYLGITEGQYWRDYRINPAEFDQKEVERNSSVLGHEFQIQANTKLITKVYYTVANRDWQRQDYSYNNRDATTGKINSAPSDVYATYTPSFIGNRPGDILYMKRKAPLRNQGFQTLGIESKIEGKYSFLGLTHEVDLGVRVHGEKNDINFKQSLSPFDYPFIRQGTPFSQQDRVIRAYAGYFQDRISITNKFKLIPGIRHEWVSQGVYTNIRQATSRDVTQKRAKAVGDTLYVSQGTESVTSIWLPGLGFTYDFLENLSWFGGVHKGFSPPTFGTAISPYGDDYRLGAETSTNYETGLRGEPTRYFSMESAVYNMLFRDQIIDTSEASSETGSRPINTGKSSHKGFENTMTFDFGKFWNWNFDMPMDFIYSHINAKSETYTRYPYTINTDNIIQLTSLPVVMLDQNGKILNPDSNGRQLPYVPKDVYTISLALRMKSGFYARGEYQYIDKQYGSLSSYRTTTNYTTFPTINGIPVGIYQNTNDETTDGNTGIIPAVGLVNASMGYKHPTGKWSVFITGKNLQDRVYISGRLPVGIHPGPTRQINIGISFDL